MKQTEEMKALLRAGAEKAIAAMGGPVAAARAMQQRYQAIQSWRRIGVPPALCQQVSKLSGVPLRELRPFDWAMYWPDETEQLAA